MRLMEKVSTVLSDNLPTIASRGAIIGAITSVFLMHKATQKANDILNAEKERRIQDSGDNDRVETLTRKEELELTWHCYVGTLITTGATVFLIFETDKLWSKKYFMVAGALEATRRTFDAYKEETKKEVGEEKEKDIQKAANEHEVPDINPPWTEPTYNNGTYSSIVQHFGYGDTIFVGGMTGQPLISSKEAIKEGFNKLNHKMNTRHISISINDVCDEFGLNRVTGGDDRGWDADETGLIEIKFEPGGLLNGNPDLPFTVIDYYTPALQDFGREQY